MTSNEQNTAEKAQLLESLTKRFGKSLDEFRTQYAPRQLNVIEVENKIALLAPISAKAIANYSMALVDPEKGMEVATRYLLEELWLAGDDEIRDDEEFFMGAMLQIQNVIQIKNSRFTKL